jgi:hypothetical protein
MNASSPEILRDEVRAAIEEPEYSCPIAQLSLHFHNFASAKSFPSAMSDCTPAYPLDLHKKQRL